MSSPELHPEPTKYTEKSSDELTLLFKDNRAAPAANKSLTGYFTSVISSFVATILSWLSPSQEAKNIREKFKNLSLKDQPLVTKTTSLLAAIRFEHPKDLSQAEVYKMRDESARALFNDKDFKELVANHADWPENGTEREGEVWRLAYAELLGQYLKDTTKKDLAKLLIQFGDQSGVHAKESKTLVAEKLFLQNCQEALAGVTQEKEKAAINEAMIHRNLSPQELADLWLSTITKLGAAGTEVSRIIQTGYTEFTGKTLPWTS